jgi:hypothetical protein
VPCAAPQALAERAQLADRLRKLVGTGVQLVEQPHVLDGDDRLIGEGSQQPNVLSGKRPRVLSSHAYGADRGVAAKKRHDGNGTISTL